MKIIVIDGPSGSGKTAMCKILSKRKHIKCYDTDIIASDCFFSIYAKQKRETTKFWKKVDALFANKIIDIKNSSGKNIQILIFAGNQQLPELIYREATWLFNIKITNLNEGYRQRIIRDCEKLAHNIISIKAFKQPRNLMTYIAHGLMINTEFPHYDQWKQQIIKYYNDIKSMNIFRILPFKTIITKILNELNYKY